MKENDNNLSLFRHQNFLSLWRWLFCDKSSSRTRFHIRSENAAAKRNSFHCDNGMAGGHSKTSSRPFWRRNLHAQRVVYTSDNLACEPYAKTENGRFSDN